jgi:hypothetical protein
MKNAFAMFILLAACAPESSAQPEKPTAEKPIYGPAALSGADSEVSDEVEKTTSAQPLTWWRYAGDRLELQDALDCALARFRAATCLPLDVSYDAAHWVRQDTQAGMPTPSHLGYTWGSWNAARTKLRDDLSPQMACDVMAHEASHILRRSNGHVGTSASANPLPASPVLIDAPTLDAVCALQPCTCYVPE